MKTLFLINANNSPKKLNRSVIRRDKPTSSRYWQRNPEDDELQRRFWGLFHPNELNTEFLLNIGAMYLCENHHLLDLRRDSHLAFLRLVKR